MEQRFGYDFSQVRVHSGGSAEQSAMDLNAHAYTIGKDIIFARGHAAKTTERQLLAHELTHVIQQSGANHSPSGLESEANDAAARVVRGEHVRVHTGTVPGLQRSALSDAEIDHLDEEQLRRRLEANEREGQSFVVSLEEAERLKHENRRLKEALLRKAPTATTTPPGQSPTYVLAMANDELFKALNDARSKLSAAKEGTPELAKYGAEVHRLEAELAQRKSVYEARLREALPEWAKKMEAEFDKSRPSPSSKAGHHVERLSFEGYGEQEYRLFAHGYSYNPSAIGIAPTVAIKHWGIGIGVLNFATGEAKPESYVEHRSGKVESEGLGPIDYILMIFGAVGVVRAIGGIVLGSITRGATRVFTTATQRALAQDVKGAITKSGPQTRASDVLNRTIGGVEDAVPRGSVGGSVNPNTRPPISAPAPNTPRPTLDEVMTPPRIGGSQPRTSTPAPAAKPAQASTAPAAPKPAQASTASGTSTPSSTSASSGTAASGSEAAASVSRAGDAPLRQAAQAAGQAATATTPSSATASDALPAESQKLNPPDSGPASDAAPREIETQVNQYTAAREQSRERRDQILARARQFQDEIEDRRKASARDSTVLQGELRLVGEKLTERNITAEERSQALTRRKQLIAEERQLIAEREFLGKNQERVRQAARVADDAYIKGVSDSARGGKGHAAVAARAGSRDEVFSAQGGISTEHIVARDLIRQKPDFQKLPTRAQQVEVFDLEDTLVRMSASANSSKGNLRWRNWPEAQWRKFTNDPGVIQRMIRNEDKVDAYIDKYLQWMLKGKAGPAPTPPTLEL